MRSRFMFLAVTAISALGCGSSESMTTSDASGGGGHILAKAGASCSSPIVLTDAWMGTHNFSEPFSWGSGSTKPACDSSTERPAVFIQWTADGDDASNFKIYVSGSESVTLEVFEDDTCSGQPKVCTHDKLPIGADHVAGAYVPVTNGQPLTAVVVARESSAPSGDWTISMGD